MTKQDAEEKVRVINKIELLLWKLDISQIEDIKTHIENLKFQTDFKQGIVKK